MTVRLPPRRVLVADEHGLRRLWWRAVDGSMHAGHGRDLSKLMAPGDRPADVSVRLVARKERFDLPGRGPA